MPLYGLLALRALSKKPRTGTPRLCPKSFPYSLHPESTTDKFLDLWDPWIQSLLGHPAAKQCVSDFALRSWRHSEISLPSLNFGLKPPRPLVAQASSLLRACPRASSNGSRASRTVGVLGTGAARAWRSKATLLGCPRGARFVFETRACNC